jgi:hypothetical protein
LAGILEARQVTEFGHEGHGAGELHSTQAFKGFDHWLPSPGFGLIL